MKSVLTKISAIKRNPNNPRILKDDKFAKLTQSIKDFPQMLDIRPIVVNDDMIVLGGNMRLKACKEAGLSEVPVIKVDDLTEEQQREFIIKDNVGFGEWDWDLLANEWDTDLLEDWGLELDFNPEDDDNAGLTDEDDVPEVTENPVSKVGDIWLLGEHRVMCGDSTNGGDVALLMNGEKADICFTSPPYNAGSLEIRGNKSTEKKYNSFEDNQTSEDYFNFLYKNLVCMMEVSNEVFYNIGLVQNNKNTIFQIITEFGDKFKDIIYWKKNTVAPHIQKGIVNNLVEFIICFGDGKRKFLNPQFSQGSYWNVIEGSNASSNDYSDIHKATFPVYLPENIIDNFSNKNSIVIDCFLGSGTTLIAAEKKNRKCYGMELDEKYCDVIVKRWQEYTGKKAIHAESGDEFVEVDNGKI